MRETAYINGQILTMDKKGTEAEAVLVSGGRIRKVGTVEEVQKAMGAGARVVDLEQKTMLPGFVDCHSHLTAVAYECIFANAGPSPKGPCDSIETLKRELKREMKQKKRKPGQWFVALGYDPEGYPEGREPTREDLDEVSRECPVCLVHRQGRRGVFNSRALEKAGIDRYTPDPEGGCIRRRERTGEPLGILEEKAFFLACEKVPMPSLKEALQGIRKAMRLYASRGITTVQEARTGEAEYELLHTAGMMGILELDVAAYLEPPAASKLLKRPWGWRTYQKRCRLAGYKIFLDGWPEAGTAWLLKPYSGRTGSREPDFCGFPAMKEEEVLEHIRLCLKYSWQIHAHANGDAAIEQFIRCYAKAREENPDAPGLRPVLVHCQMVGEQQLDRMKELGIRPSFFPDQIYYRGDLYAEELLGAERADRINPARWAMERGMDFTLHQDSPQSPPDMLLSVYSAVNRRTRQGRLLGEGQRIPVEEALRAVTIYGARQMFEEREKGSIEEGKKADLVILDRNPLKVLPEEIRKIRVLATVKEGRTVAKQR